MKQAFIGKWKRFAAEYRVPQTCRGSCGIPLGMHVATRARVRSGRRFAISTVWLQVGERCILDVSHMSSVWR